MAHSAPGKHYRKGISLMEIMDMFPDDATAEDWFASIRWPDEVACGRCGSLNVLVGPLRDRSEYLFFECETGPGSGFDVECGRECP